MSTLVPSGVPRESKDQDSTGSYSRSHGARPGAALGPDLLPSSRPARCPPVSPSIHRPFAGYEMWDIPASTPDEPGGRQTTGLRLPRYSLASREGDRPVALSRSWKRMPPLALDGSACHRRPDGHQVAPSSAQGQLPITNCWARNQGQSRCRIAKNPRPATMLNHRPETVTMLRHKIRGRPTQGSPGSTCHSVEPDRSRSTGSRFSLSRAGCPTAPEPGAAATPGGRSSHPRTW